MQRATEKLDGMLLPCNLEQLNDRINNLGVSIASMGDQDTIRVHKAFLITVLGYMEELFGLRRENDAPAPSPADEGATLDLMAEYLGENDDCPAAALGIGPWPECNGEAERCGDDRMVGGCWKKYFLEKVQGRRKKMNEKPTSDEVVNAVGAMAEMSWIFYSTAVKQGFTAVQALQLTQTYLSSMIMKPPVTPPDQE